MKRIIGIASLSLLLGLAVFLEFGAGRPAGSPSAPAPAYVPGQVLVKFKTTVSPGMKSALISLTKSRVLSRILELNLYVVQIAEEATVEDMVSFYARNPSVVYAQPNYIYHTAVTPNDALFVYQYALYNRGQEIGWFPGSPQGNPNADIKALAAWEETTGSEDVIIAILDTGVDLIHPDLKNKLKSSGRDAVNNDFDATDDNGHGTMVAGIAAAESNNFEGDCRRGLEMQNPAGEGSRSERPRGSKSRSSRVSSMPSRTERKSSTSASGLAAAEPGASRDALRSAYRDQRRLHRRRRGQR